MVLGLSWLQILIIGGATVYLIGEYMPSRCDTSFCDEAKEDKPLMQLCRHKNLPAAAKLAGRSSGKAVAYISAARQKFSAIARSAEIDKAGCTCCLFSTSLPARPFLKLDLLLQPNRSVFLG